MSKVRKRTRWIVVATLLIATPLAAQGPDETRARRGVESVHQPVVGGGRAMVMSCPDWTDFSHHPSEAQSRNFGCATASNLAAMIADPDDLIVGRHTNGAAADTATKAIRSWRDPSGAKTSAAK